MVRIIGHRGSGAGRGSHGLHENSLSSVEKAFQEGAQEVECDLALTADGHVVVHHDESAYVNNRSVLVRDLTLEQIQKALPHVTTLKNMLAVVDARSLLLELKGYTDWRNILDCIASEVANPGNLRFISFEAKALTEVRKRWSQAYCNYIATCIEDRFEPFATIKHVQLCAGEGFNEISGHYLVLPKRVSQNAREKGIAVGLGMIDSRPALALAASRAERFYTNRVNWLRVLLHHRFKNDTAF